MTKLTAIETAVLDLVRADIHMPSPPAFAHKLGVSVGRVRTALKSLEARKLVESRPGHRNSTHWRPANTGNAVPLPNGEYLLHVVSGSGWSRVVCKDIEELRDYAKGIGFEFLRTDRGMEAL